MKKYSLALTFLLSTISTQILLAQLSEKERLERCENNKQRYLELKTQSKILEQQLAYTADAEKFARDAYGSMNKAVTDVNWRKSYVGTFLKTPNDRKEMAQKMGITWDEGFLADEVLLLKAMREAQSAKVQQIKSALEHHDELKQQKAENDKTISWHYNNLIALGCDMKGIEENKPVNNGEEKPKEPTVDPLSGTWQTTINDPLEGCSTTYTIVLKPAGDNLWTGTLMGRGNCKDGNGEKGTANVSFKDPHTLNVVVPGKTKEPVEIKYEGNIISFTFMLTLEVKFVKK